MCLSFCNDCSISACKLLKDHYKRAEKIATPFVILSCAMYGCFLSADNSCLRCLLQSVHVTYVVVGHLSHHFLKRVNIEAMGSGEKTHIVPEPPGDSTVLVRLFKYIDVVKWLCLIFWLLMANTSDLPVRKLMVCPVWLHSCSCLPWKKAQFIWPVIQIWCYEVIFNMCALRRWELWVLSFKFFPHTWTGGVHDSDSP